MIKNLLAYSIFTLSLLLSGCGFDAEDKIPEQEANETVTVAITEGELLIESDKIGAQILIDGKRSGTIESNKTRIDLKFGEYSIKLEDKSRRVDWHYFAQKDILIDSEFVKWRPDFNKQASEYRIQRLAAEQQDLELLKKSEKVLKITKRYQENDNGTITDLTTGLTWMQCIQGQSGNMCEQGQSAKVSLAEAKIIANNSSFAGHNDWRVPKIVELHTLVRCFQGRTPILRNDDNRSIVVKSQAQNGECFSKIYGVATINKDLFPNTPLAPVLSDSSIDENNNWLIDFSKGNEMPASNKNGAVLRLVRGGN